MRVRPIADGDVDAVIELWKACDLMRPWNDPRTDIALARRTPNAELLIGEADGRVVASVMCGSDGHRGWIYYLSVTPDCRGEGLGRNMVRHAEACLGAMGVVKVELMIRDDNQAVQGFYEAIGYEIEPCLIMSRWLASAGTRNSQS